MQLVNHTSFVTGATVLLNKEGYEVLLLLIKATYVWTQEGKLILADEQVPVNMTDVFYGDPGKSSVKYCSDFAFSKPGTDVVLIGHAYVTKGKCRSLDVSFEVTGSLKKAIRIFGDRVWKKSIVGHSISRPAYFDKMPLIFERSFGGIDTTHTDPKRHGWEPRNPVGTGYLAKNAKKVEGTRLPNLENPKELIRDWKDNPEPAGFGFIGSDWEPRRGYSGTYDKSWATSRSPLLPDDFDDRYFLSAHPTQVVKDTLIEGEWVRGVNLSPPGQFKFQLPSVTPKVVVRTVDRDFAPIPKMDTLVVEPDVSRATIVWAARTMIHRRLHSVREIRVHSAA